ncbi:hypothetical protein [Arthrobacter alpinus]|uniref:hypothetical protein n=1 Tax=Arthrobacter alpinus TaxID=656366 RepID=UPI0012FEDE8F|nr:hypothetical protein [Arthrobacter alpinus]
MLAARVVLGSILFAAAIVVLGSTSAFAASHSSSATQPSSKQDSSSGLLSGNLSPIGNVVDKTIAQVPVVHDIRGIAAVDTVLAPVTTATDNVEKTVAAAPVAGPVIAQPVVNAIDAVAAPVLGAVDQVTQPVLPVVAPVIDPVSAAVNPIVDSVVGGVSGGIGAVVDEVVASLPSLPEIPGTNPILPQVPVSPGEPGTLGNPGLPDVVGGELPGVIAALASDSSKQQAGATPAVPVKGALPVVATSSIQNAVPSPFKTPMEVLAGVGLGHGEPLSGATPLHPDLDSTDVPSTACGSNAGLSVVGPCAADLATAAGPGPSGAGPGGAGGSSGTAANENFSGSLVFAAGSSATGNADWPLPASMPSHPGSSPD